MGYEYASLTFWMLVIVFSALGVHQLWSSLIQPKIVNSILLPGTLVAQLGHVLGLLITGGTVTDTSLVKDDDSGEPQTGGDTESRVPIVGPIVIALLPMAGCAVAIYWVSRYFGSDILAGMSDESVNAIHLPTSIPFLFDMLGQSLAMVEQLIYVVAGSNYTSWETMLFLYLAICLTVRMAPLTGNLRGSLGAIFIFGILAFLLGQFAQSDATGPLSSAWPLVTFSVAVLLFLLLFSLIVKGIVSLVKTLFGQG